ncbi:MAG: SDR family oxidoreductase [Pseudomonadota bacterium]
MTLHSLHNALVVVTGASSGIGRAAAQAFARQGARLVLAARDASALGDAVGECTRLGATALAVPTDMTDSQAVEHLVTTAARFGDGRIDIWVNNAGVGAVGRFEQTPLEAHEQVIQTDLLGYLRGAHGVLPYFKAQGAGVLINTLSIGSWLAQPYAVAYSASKFGLLGFSQALRGELVDWPSIHVCDVFPAVVDTPGFRDGGNYAGVALRPPPPLYDPRRVARATVKLALRPRSTLTVGASAALARWLRWMPQVEMFSGRLTGWALDQARPRATSSGNLFHPPVGERRIDGGWRRSRPSPWLLAGTAAAVGLGWWLLRPHSQAGQAGPSSSVAAEPVPEV